jgi:hypothetical protein
MIHLNTKNIGCFAIIAAFFGSFILFFDLMIGYQLYQQFDARRTFTSHPAVVTGSFVERVVSNSGGRRSGTSVDYKPDIRYTYTVGGTEYQGDRYSFIDFAHPDRASVEQIVSRYSIGQTIEIWIDPNDPSRSVVDTSNAAFPSTVIIFLLPFNAILLCLALWFLRNIKHLSAPEHEHAALPLIVSSTPTRLVLRDQRLAPVSVFLIALAISSFACTFPLLFLAGGFMAPWSYVLAALAICTLVAVFFTTRAVLRRIEPARRIIIDHDTRTLARADGSETYALDSIKNVAIESIPKFKAKRKAHRETWYIHEAVAVLENKTRVPLVSAQGHKDKRRELKPWFETALGLAAPDPAPPD